MEEQPEVNRAKIRLGLAMVGVVVCVALVLFFVIQDPLGRAIMFGVALAAIIRAYLLTKSLRRGEE